MNALIERLAEAGGPDRDLDAWIAVATTETVKTADDLIYAKQRSPGHDATHPGHYFIQSRSGASCRTAPAFTASIDAALTLVSEGHDWNLHVNKGAAIADCLLASEDGCERADSHGATPCRCPLHRGAESPRIHPRNGDNMSKRKGRMSFSDALAMVPDDMPDGAAFAMAHEIAGLDYGDGFDELAEEESRQEPFNSIQRRLPHKCPSCNRRFGSQMALFQHHQDTGHPSFACQECKRAFLPGSGIK